VVLFGLQRHIAGQDNQDKQRGINGAVRACRCLFDRRPSHKQLAINNINIRSDAPHSRFEHCRVSYSFGSLRSFQFRICK
jgi:hypothetical protein